MVVRGRDLVKKSFAALHAVYALKSFYGVNGRVAVFVVENVMRVGGWCKR
jgi:hypothetical protein